MMIAIPQSPLKPYSQFIAEKIQSLKIVQKPTFSSALVHLMAPGHSRLDAKDDTGVFF